MLLVPSRWISGAEPTFRLLGGAGAGAAGLFVLSFAFISGRFWAGLLYLIFHDCCHAILEMICICTDSLPSTILFLITF